MPGRSFPGCMDVLLMVLTSAVYGGRYKPVRVVLFQMVVCLRKRTLGTHRPFDRRTRELVQLWVGSLGKA